MERMAIRSEIDGLQRLKVGPSLLAPLLVAVAYIVFAELGFSLASTTRQISAVWPPTGIAVASLLLFGYRVWPGIALGALVSNAATGEPLWTAAAIALGNTLAPLASAFALRRLRNFDTALEQVRDVLALAFFGCAGMLISATNGSLVLLAAGTVAPGGWPAAWATWYAGDAMGVLLVAPLMLTWMQSERALMPARPLEYAALLASLVAAAFVSFVTNLPLAYPVYPWIVWSALRFRQRETTLAVAVCSGIAIFAAAAHLGRFAGTSSDASLIVLVTFMAVLAMTGLILGAAATERRRALEASTKVAETLQAAFLPERLPQRETLSCDALYLAAGSEAHIGGDWYDVFELLDGRIVVSIGDVIGHGLTAAITAGRLRQSIFTAAYDTADPAGILQRVNRMLGSHSSTIATALVAIVDADLSVMRYASAGHPPPMLAAPGIAPSSLAFGGIPLGVEAATRTVTREVALRPGAVLLFYTDGLLEFDREPERNEVRLLEAVGRLAAETIERPASFLLHAIMENARPADDTALIVLRLAAAAAHNAALGELRCRTWSFDTSDAARAHAVRHEAAAFLRCFGPSSEELFHAELVIGELIANTVEHAPGTVQLDIDWTGERPVITMRDTGPGLAPSPETALPDDLSEKGRGLYLVSSLAKDLDIESVPGNGTTLRVVLAMSR